MIKGTLLCFLYLFSFVSLATECGFRVKIHDFSFAWSPDVLIFKHRVEIQRENVSRQCQRFILTFSKGNSSSYLRYLGQGDGKIDYNIYQDEYISTSLKDFADVLFMNEVISGLFLGENKVCEKEFVIKVNHIDYYTHFSSGVYRDTIEVSLYQSLKKDSPKILSNYFNIYTTIPPVTLLSLVNHGQAFDPTDTHQTLNYGILEKNESLEFDLRVMANTSYSVLMSSLNNGRMQRRGSSGSFESGRNRIQYQLKMNGRALALENTSQTPREVFRHRGQSNRQSDTYHVEGKIIDTIWNKQTGVYEDYVTIITQSLE